MCDREWVSKHSKKRLIRRIHLLEEASERVELRALRYIERKRYIEGSFVDGYNTIVNGRYLGFYGFPIRVPPPLIFLCTYMVYMW